MTAGPAADQPVRSGRLTDSAACADVMLVTPRIAHPRTPPDVGPPLRVDGLPGQRRPQSTPLARTVAI